MLTNHNNTTLELEHPNAQGDIYAIARLGNLRQTVAVFTQEGTLRTCPLNPSLAQEMGFQTSNNRIIVEHEDETPYPKSQVYNEINKYNDLWFKYPDNDSCIFVPQRNTWVKHGLSDELRTNHFYARYPEDPTIPKSRTKWDGISYEIIEKCIPINEEYAKKFLPLSHVLTFDDLKKDNWLKKGNKYCFLPKREHNSPNQLMGFVVKDCMATPSYEAIGLLDFDETVVDWHSDIPEQLTDLVSTLNSYSWNPNRSLITSDYVIINRWIFSDDWLLISDRFYNLCNRQSNQITAFTFYPPLDSLGSVEKINLSAHFLLKCYEHGDITIHSKNKIASNYPQSFQAFREQEKQPVMG